MYFSMFVSFYLLFTTILAQNYVNGAVSSLFHPKCRINSNCFNGECINDTCVCHSGWNGDQCQNCNGRITLTEPSGIIIDGHGNYSENTRCTWLLRYENKTSNTTNNYLIKLTINKFTTECGWDHFYAFDGPVLHSPLRAVLSGSIPTQTEITLRSGYGLLYFFSDSALTLEGFNITYRYILCPNDCSSHGTCSTSLTCICHPQWTGVDCSIPITVCNNNCNNGTCVKGVCVCDSYYTGDDCSTPLSPSALSWSLINTVNNPAGRASAAVVYYNESLYVYGGETITQRHLLISENISESMYRLDLVSNKWYNLTSPHYSTKNWLFSTLSPHQPTNTLYLSCGERDGVITNTVQSYNVEMDTWSNIQSAPIAVKGHTSHIINDKLMLLFGFNDKGFHSGLQIYDIILSNWTTVTEFFGVVVKGRYSHTSVYHESNNSLFVYGGYMADYKQRSYQISQALYQLDLNTNTWLKLLSGPATVFLHSSVIWYNKMVIFGGDSHSNGTKRQCSSDVVYTYDFCCGDWSKIEVNSNNIKRLSRYGHHMFNDQHGELYSYGGYNGLVLNELIKLNKPNCSLITDELTCENNSYSDQLSFCDWDENNGCSDRKYDALYACHHTCPFTNDDYQQQLCSNLSTCHDCNATAGCKYLSGLSNTCIADHQMRAHYHEANSCKRRSCTIHRSCYMCNNDTNCYWSSVYAGCVNRSPDRENVTSDDCSADCSSHTSCNDCTSENCLWCASQNTCITANTYVLNFNYGQCLSWSNNAAQCDAAVCSSSKTCSECQRNPECGWCNADEDTGLGECMELSSFNDNNTCSEEQWYFEKCPACQCNGHSECYNGTDQCIQCSNLTTGEQCEKCTDGFYGDSHNGGICLPCDCEGVATTCDPDTGDCKCEVQGATGPKCDECDISKNYRYSSHLDQCYYNVGMDYRYTFNLSKPDDKYIQTVNIQSRPKYDDRDVEFTLTCFSAARITMTYYNSGVEEEKKPSYTTLISDRLCDEDTFIEETFSDSELSITRDINSTFILSINNITTPFVFKVSFSQYSINLFTFFLVFFGCFLLLLIVAGASWKLRIRYNNHRRRQRARAERLHMANRPFASILLYDSDLQKLPQPQIPALARQPSITQTANPEPREGLLRSLSKRGKKRRFPLTQKHVTPMTIEYLNSHRVAVYNTIIKLPNGKSDKTPDGASGLAIASTLITNPLTNNLSRATYKNGKTTIGSIA